MNETFPIKQTKFSNGEISEMLRGETSHPKYGASVRLCKNWIPVPQGALVKRPGTKFVAPVKDASYAPRLIPFVFSDAQAFLLEFGNLYVRFYKQSKYVGVDGALHVYGDSYVGGYYELVTPFTTAMLPYLKYAQVGDVITICYGGQVAGVAATAPQDLKHTSGANSPWTIAATSLKIPAGVVTWAGGANALFDGVIAHQNGIVYNKGDRATRVDAAGAPGPNTVEWIAIQEAVTGAAQKPPDPATLNASATQLSGNLFWMPAVDQAHPAVKWNWVQTAVVQDSAGVVYESAPCPPLTINSSLSTDRQRPIGAAVATIAGGYTFLFYKSYRASAGGIYGWVQDVYPANFIASPNGFTPQCVFDDGRTPDYTRQPPAGTDPFLVSGADSYPSVVGYLDQRRLWGASLKFPASLFLSKIGDLYNYDGIPAGRTPGADTDAMMITLASEVLEQVRSFVPKRRGLILTGQGEWAIAGTGGGPISRSSQDAKKQSDWGASWLNPLKIGTGILFNTAKSNMVRDLYPLYGLYADIWDGQDLSVMARHLFDLHTLKDWAFQSAPYPVAWAVRDDGVLLSLTYQHAPPSFGQQITEGVVAWAQHGTGVGSDAFESVCVVPEPPEDAVYLGVKRLVNAIVKRNIERMDSPICAQSPYLSGISDVRYGRYADAVTLYDGHGDQIGYTGVNAFVDPFGHTIDANALAVWRFDEALATSALVDATGHYGNLILSGGGVSIPPVAGKIAGARQLGGSTPTGFISGVSFLPGDAAVVAVQTGSWTWEGWIWIDPSIVSTFPGTAGSNTALTVGDAILGDLFDDSNSTILGISLTAGGRMRVYSWNAILAEGPVWTTLTRGAWHHFAVRGKAAAGGKADVAFFLDGVLQSTVLGANRPATVAVDPEWIIGGSVDQNQFKGRMDDMRFSNIARTDAEILLSASAGKIGTTVKIVVAGGPFVASDAANPYGSGFVLDPENTLGLGVVKAHIVAFTNSTQVTAELDNDLTQDQTTAWHAGKTVWAIAKGQITAAHLSGYQQDSGDVSGARGVVCLADGDVQALGTWVAGVASLAIPAVVIQLGVSYNADASLLDAWTSQAEIRNRFKNLLRMGFEVAGTRDMWVGKDFDNLTEWTERQVSDAYGVMGLHTGYFEEFVTGEYSKTGQAVLRHFQPLPAIISSVLREMRLGDT